VNTRRTKEPKLAPEDTTLSDSRKEIMHTGYHKAGTA